MNGVVLLIPFFFIRFILLFYLNKDAVKRAAHFAPTQGFEMYAYYIYQISNIAIFIYLCFLSVIIEKSWICMVGVLLYTVGLLLCAITMINFARPSENGMNTYGLYRFSRNPMYVSYALYFIGCVILTQSFSLLCIVIVFQISSHWMIVAEERWCLEKFDSSYKNYMKSVRRYF